MQRGVAVAAGTGIAALAVIAVWWVASSHHEPQTLDRSPTPLAIEVESPTFTLPATEVPSHELAPTPQVPDSEAEPRTAQTEEAAPAGKIRITGRILRANGATPASGALVNLDGISPFILPSAGCRQVTDLGGRFFFELGAGEALRGAELTAVSADESEWFARDFKLTGTTDNELGDLVLQVFRSVSLQVVDSLGVPIPGACAVASSLEDGPLAVTDDRGRATLEPIPTGCSAVDVWALGYGGLHIDVGHGTSRSEIVVQMKRCPLLVLHVTGADGSDPEGLSVRITAANEMFTCDLGAESSSARTFARAADRTHMSEPMAVFHPRDPGPGAGTGVVAYFQPFARKPVVVGNLLSGVPLEVSLMDATGAVCWGPLPVSLGLEETREIELAPQGRPRRVQVRVLDPDGQPVTDGWVLLSSEERDGLGGSAAPDSEGIATFDNVMLASGTIGIQCPPWARAVLRNMSLQSEAPIDVTVQPGRKLAVSLVDASSRPAGADMIFVTIEGYHFPHIEFAASREEAMANPRRSVFQVPGLPDGLVQLTVVRDELSFHHDVDTSQTEVTLRVPWSDAE